MSRSAPLDATARGAEGPQTIEIFRIEHTQFGGDEQWEACGMFGRERFDR
jgi:hypothetical protein